MFGREYSSHPEILLDSFKDMSHEYGKKVKVKKNGNLLIFLQKVYIKIFGIPEIGFQLRSMYFKDMLIKKMQLKPKNILDAGSGIGVYAIWAKKNFPNAVVTGCEIDKNKLKFSNKFTKELGAKNLSFIYGDVTKKINGQNSYDLIINIDVLEHIKDYKKVLSNFYKLLSPKGYLYIHTPQPKQKRLFKNLEKWHHEDHVHEGFWPEELKNELEKLGFKIVALRETFGFFGKLSWELNHIFLSKNFIISGITFPMLLMLSRLDLFLSNRNGLATAILLQKKS